MKLRDHLIRDGLAALALGLATWAGVAVLAADGPVAVDSVDGVLALAYSEVSADQVPTGVLLERGATYAGERILLNDGRAA